MIGKLKLPTLGVLALAEISALLLVTALPAQAQNETIIDNLLLNPTSRLTADSAGNLYGTTGSLGAGGGTVYELSPSGRGGWNETVLYYLPGPGGPNSYLIFDSLGNLYGTTAGNYGGYGFVFENGTIIYSFTGGADGGNPCCGLVMDSAGNIYGMAGNVFELSPSDGGWTEQVIYDGEATGLAIDPAGSLFGVSSSTIFELIPNGDGTWNPVILHTFPSGSKDGVTPHGVPALDGAGNLYGTTYGGGKYNYGTVYKLSPVTTGPHKGSWTEKILHSFRGGPLDGSGPEQGVMLDAEGNIYGTTSDGGKGTGGGTVFELAGPVGKGSYEEKILWSFNVLDGFGPSALIMDSAGDLYGTASGGPYYWYDELPGIAFELNPSSAPQIPRITSVSRISAQQSQTITIKGSGFGNLAPFSGLSPFLCFYDHTGGWITGCDLQGVDIGITVSSWTDSQIILGALGRAPNVGDVVSFVVWSAQSGAVTDSRNYTVVAGPN
jgi:uncharacterized repeat protein (TIGR03803 family)